MKSVTTHEAKTHLSKLLAEVEGGEEIVIRRGDHAVAKLVAAGQPASRRPRAGKATSEPIEYTKEALGPLSEGDLEEWGL